MRIRIVRKVKVRQNKVSTLFVIKECRAGAKEGGSSWFLLDIRVGGVARYRDVLPSLESAIELMYENVSYLLSSMLLPGCQFEVIK